MKNLKIINRSKWPDYALKVLCPWIVKRAGITWSYQIIVKSTTKDTWRGMGWEHKCHITIPRRFKKHWPWEYTDSRFHSDRFSFTFKSRIEVLIFLIAHEAWHATGGNPENWISKKGNTCRKSMERDCNEFGAELVEAYRAHRSQFVREFRNMLAYEKAVEPTSVLRTEKKFDHVQRQLWNWQSKLQRAQKKVKTYNQKLQYYNKRLAALKGE